MLNELYNLLISAILFGFYKAFLVLYNPGSKLESSKVFFGIDKSFILLTKESNDSPDFACYKNLGSTPSCFILSS
jgi:hypothetical protein